MGSSWLTASVETGRGSANREHRKPNGKLILWKRYFPHEHESSATAYVR